MKTSHLLSSTKNVSGKGTKSAVAHQVKQEELAFDFLSLDGTDVTFVSQTTMGAAIKKGAGVMIGDYFVGMTTGSDLLYSQPVIVY